MTDPVYVLGINAYHGDVSAVLLRDGAVVAALEEERFTRIKHYAGFPTQSHPALPRDGRDRRRRRRRTSPSAATPRRTSSRRRSSCSKSGPRCSLHPGPGPEPRNVRDVDGPAGAGARPRPHRASARPPRRAPPGAPCERLFLLPFEDAAVAAIDGFGDFVSTSLAAGHGNTLEVLERVYFPHSLGMLYTAVTQYLGFLALRRRVQGDGAGPLRQADLRRRGPESGPAHARRHVRARARLLPPLERRRRDGMGRGLPHDGPRLRRQAITELLGPARDPDEEVSSTTRTLRTRSRSSTRRPRSTSSTACRKRRSRTNLCLAGGCGMNSVANGKIRANTPFDEIYVQPAAGDNGTASRRRALGVAPDARPPARRSRWSTATGAPSTPTPTCPPSSTRPPGPRGRRLALHGDHLRRRPRRRSRRRPTCSPTAT